LKTCWQPMMTTLMTFVMTLTYDHAWMYIVFMKR
jgi:hypothetical protein